MGIVSTIVKSEAAKPKVILQPFSKLSEKWFKRVYLVCAIKYAWSGRKYNYTEQESITAASNDSTPFSNPLEVKDGL